MNFRIHWLFSLILVIAVILTAWRASGLLGYIATSVSLPAYFGIFVASKRKISVSEICFLIFAVTVGLSAVIWTTAFALQLEDWPIFGRGATGVVRSALVGCILGAIFSCLSIALFFAIRPWTEHRKGDHDTNVRF